MQLHLVLPGLLWPGKALHDTAFDLDLPALSWLLGRGRQAWQPPQPLEHWLCGAFSIDQSPPPVAALRLLGEGGDPGEELWLCADPACLKIEQRRMSLDTSDVGVSAAEMQQIVAALAPLLADTGEFYAGEPGRAYLKLRRPPRLLTLPPSATAGHSNPLPSGADADFWQRLGNEVQMLLHTLPLNAQRETAGRPLLNSLWFWGAGRLPPRTDSAAFFYQNVIGNHSLLNGLAAWSGISRSPAPTTPDALPHGSLLLLDTLQAATQQLDALAWRTALMDIERDWLQPLRQALRAGRINCLRLTALGDEAILDLTLTRGDALKFWRRPQSLHALNYRLAHTK